MNDFPRSIEEIDSSWLTRALRRSGTIGVDDLVRIVGVEPVAGGTAFAGLLYRIRLEGGPAPSVVVKLPVGGILRPVLDGIGAYTREISFYRDLAREAPVRCARALVAEMAPEGTDFVLVLEDLGDKQSRDQLTGLTVAQAENTLDALAELHAWSWEHPRLQEHGDTFPPLDSARGRAVAGMYRQAYEASWPNIRKQTADRIDPQVLRFGEELPDLLPLMEKRLASPRTIVHGELRAENLFFDRENNPTLIDFQIVQQECGSREVAYLITQSLPTDLRKGRDESLMQRYWDRLVANGVTGYPWERAWDDYRLATAYNFLYPVMAAARWDEVPGRGQTVLLAMIERSAAAIVDNEALPVVAQLRGS